MQKLFHIDYLVNYEYHRNIHFPLQDYHDFDPY